MPQTESETLTMYDFIGDVHGCMDELWILLETLGYRKGMTIYPQLGRQLVFVGDLTDRGPKSVDVLRVVMQMTDEDIALVVEGNHDNKLGRALKPGSKVQAKHGLAETLEALSKEPEYFRQNVEAWLHDLPFRLVLDEGKVIACHAGLPEKMHTAPETGKMRSHALYGDVDGKTDAAGLPIRKDWTKDYSGSRVVVHGHVPVKEPDIRNNVYNIDTGCCFGGKLTALRYPEMELVSVPALATYSKREDW